MSTTRTIPTVKVVPSHITIDDKGIARVDGTRMKVQHLVEAWKAGADSPEKLHESYPHLSLAQIYDALGYYYEHQREMDAKIAQTLRDAESMRLAAPETPGRKKLRERGLRP